MAGDWERLRGRGGPWLGLKGVSLQRRGRKTFWVEEAVWEDKKGFFKSVGVFNKYTSFDYLSVNEK